MARHYFVTPKAVQHRIARVAAGGEELPLSDTLLAKLVGPRQPGENTLTHQRRIHLLGIEITPTQN